MPAPVPTKEAIVRAAQALARVCDGAQDQDGVGYNGVDSPTAKSILRSRNPSDRQIRALWNILRKYRGQLSGFGIDYDSLVPPELVPSGSREPATPKGSQVRLFFVDTPYGRQVAVAFAYDGGIVGAVKGPSGTKRWFDKDGKRTGQKNSWTIPDDLDALGGLLGRLGGLTPPAAVDLDQDVSAFMKSEYERRKTNLVESRAETADFDVPTKVPLYPFQRAGVRWIDAHDGRALLADDQGLGKSPQALGYLLLHPEALPALVVCPSSVRVNWRNMVHKFTDLKPLVITAKSSLKAFRDQGVVASDKPEDGYDVTIVNYDLFRSYETDESKEAREKADPTKPKPIRKYENSLAGIPIDGYLKFRTIVYDEIHKLKDGSSQRGRAGKALAKDMPHVIGLSGTPIPNRPIEIYNQAKIVRPQTFPDYIDFGIRFCNGFKNNFGWDFTGSSNLDQLDDTLRSKGGMIRRLKKDVMKELPAKTRITIPIILEKGLAQYRKETAPILEKLAQNRAERDEWRAKMGALSEEDRKRYMAAHAAEAVRKNKLTSYMIDEIEKVKMAALHAKFDESVKFYLDVFESKGKLLLFATHHETTDRMLAVFRKEGIRALSIDSRTPQALRQGIVEDFQEKDLGILVGGIRAMSEGLTLTATDTVGFMEYDFSPTVHWQAEDRAHRISQTKAVTVYYTVALGTIEEKLARMIDAKQGVIFAAMGESDRSLDETGIMDSIVDDLTAELSCAKG